jgi:excisionase family DNA binding protein
VSLAPELAAALRPLARLLVPLIREELTKDRAADDRIPHGRSPLGRRRTLRLIRTGQLPAEHVGRTYYVKRADLDAYMRAHAVPRAAPSPDDSPEGEDDGFDAFLDDLVPPT